MRYLQSISLLLFIAVINWLPAEAQTDADTVQQLTEAVVTAHRINKEIIPVQTLTGAALTKMSSHSVADAIRYFSGVQLKDYGGVGGLKTVNVRSMGSHHVGVFYEGIEISNPQNGVVDLGRYSLDNIGSVSLYNGQKSSIFQPAKDFASASSIYIHTKTPFFAAGEKYHLKGGFKTGAFGLVNPSVLWEQQITENLSSATNVEYIRSSGKYKFTYKVVNNVDDRGGYDTTAIRQNGDINVIRAEQAFFGKLQGGEWKARVYFYGSERGYPGAVTKEPGQFKHEDRQKDRNFFVQSSVKKQLTKSYSTLLSGKYAQDYIHYQSDSLIQQLDNEYTLHDVYFSWANMLEVLSFWSVNISTDFQWNKMTSNLYDFIYPQRFSEWVAVATSVYFSRFKVQASLLGTFIQESTHEFKKPTDEQKSKVTHNRSHYTPTVMAAWQPFGGYNFHLRAFYKDIFRMPTFTDMYLAYMGSLSSFLKPEFTQQYNVGFVWGKKLSSVYSFNLQADAYYNKVTDKITAVPGGVNFRWTMKNVGLVKIRGIDVALDNHLQITPVFTLDTRLNYTYQKAQDYSPMQVESDTMSYKGQISYIPWHSGSAVVNAAYKSWGLNYSFIYTGNRYTWSANIPANKVLAWYTSDLSLSKTFDVKKMNIRVTAEVNNLFNQQYDVVLNYPMPGTNFKFIISISI